MIASAAAACAADVMVMGAGTGDSVLVIGIGLSSAQLLSPGVADFNAFESDAFECYSRAIWAGQGTDQVNKKNDVKCTGRLMQSGTCNRIKFDQHVGEMSIKLIAGASKTRRRKWMDAAEFYGVVRVDQCA